MLCGQQGGAMCCDPVDGGPSWDSVGRVRGEQFPKIGPHGRQVTRRHPKVSALEIWREIWHL